MRNGTARITDETIHQQDKALAVAQAEHAQALAGLREKLSIAREPPTPIETPTPLLIEAVRRVLFEHGSDHCAACRELASMMSID